MSFKVGDPVIHQGNAGVIQEIRAQPEPHGLLCAVKYDDPSLKPFWAGEQELKPAPKSSGDKK